jgi:hypothetical protein
MKTADGKADSPGTHIILCHAESRAKCRDGSWENNNGFVCEEGLEGRVRSERELIGIFFSLLIHASSCLLGHRSP